MVLGSGHNGTNTISHSLSIAGITSSSSPHTALVNFWLPGLGGYTYGDSISANTITLHTNNYDTTYRLTLQLIKVREAEYISIGAVQMCERVSVLESFAIPG